MHRPYQIPNDISSSEEALKHRGECILELLDSWDGKLNFLKSDKPVLAAEYASWHALVRMNLNPSTKLEGTDRSASQVDFEFAQSCFRKIEKAHQIFKGYSIQYEVD
jgi:hypothetical protein